MNVSESKIEIIECKIMKIFVNNIHTIFLLKSRKSGKKKIVKSYCHLPLYHHVKMNGEYELLSNYILMI